MRTTDDQRHRRGQATVEFSLVLMAFLTVIVAIAEFAFFLTIKINVTDASQDAVQTVAEMGNSPDADFSILQVVETDMGAPADKSKILSVEVIWTNSYGTANYGENRYTRTGTLRNSAATASVPFAQNGGSSYPYSQRCSIVSGVGCYSGHATVDWVAVKITYQYAWVTPLPGMIGLSGAAPTFVQISICRLEPIQ